MYSLKVLHISASGKSIFASVIKIAGIVKSTVATGSIALADGVECPKVGDVIELPGITKVSTFITTDETSGKEFTWLALD